MNICTILFGTLLCLVVVNARHFKERNEEERLLTEENNGQTDSIRKYRQHGADEMRHRRKRWQMSYGYNYPPPANPFYPDERRDYNRNQQELLPQIIRLLDEINVYVKRPPPPPPQPIYVPYPVPYPIPQYCNCPSRTNKNPNITTRFPQMDDTNQNWGFVDEGQSEESSNDDGVRPISFDPIRPSRPTSRPPPSVDHGSNQATSDLTTQAPNFMVQQQTSSAARTPGVCDAAVLSCCRPMANRQQQRNCFTILGCGASYANGNACSSEAIASVLETFSKAYAPVN